MVPLDHVFGARNWRLRWNMPNSKNIRQDEGAGISSLLMRSIPAVGGLFLLALVGCHLAPNGSSVNRAEAQKTSDAFMSDLVANRVDLALTKMEPEFVQAAGQTKAEQLFQQMFNYCGRPLDAHLERDEIGFFAYADGRKKPMRAFFYTGKTTQHEEGIGFFAVRVVPGDKGIKVVNFGPLKQLK
jgi:hypothetical protein